ERKVVFHHRAATHISELFLLAAAVLAKLEHGAEIFVGGEDRSFNPWLLHFLDMIWLRHVDGIVDFELSGVGGVYFLDQRGRGRDQIEIEFARQPLLNNFEMQQSEKSAAETEAERG